MRRRYPNTVLVAFIKKWRMKFATLMVAFYTVAMALVVFVFPDVSNLWVSFFILSSGFFGSLLSLADLLVSAEEAVRDDGNNPEE